LSPRMIIPLLSCWFAPGRSRAKLRLKAYGILGTL
jgi:hypothetical protein